MANKYFTTPKGRASYPKLVTPDTKFNAEGVYQTKLLIPAEDAAPLVEQIDEVFVEEFGQKKLASMAKPYKIDENGDYLFNFKSKNKPQLFDAAGKPVKANKDLKLGNGSVLKIKGTIGLNLVQSKHYVSLYLNAAQIIDMVEFGGAGFDADNSGSFKADDLDEDTADEANAAVAASQDAEDF